MAEKRGCEEIEREREKTKSGKSGIVKEIERERREEEPACRRTLNE